MEKIILFQGDSITDVDRPRGNDYYLGSGYATMVAGQLGLDHPGDAGIPQYGLVQLRAGLRGIHL